MTSKAATLSVFRRIMKVARRWPAMIGDPTAAEERTQDDVEYIQTSAREGFRSNRHLKDPEEIAEKLREANDRMEIAMHYKIPYPKHHHGATGSVDALDPEGASRAWDQSHKS